MPPQIKFNMPQIKMACVGGDGRVDIMKICDRGGRAWRWNPNHTLAEILCAIRDNMMLPQVSQASQGLMESSY